MSVAAILAVASAWLLGVLAVSVLWPKKRAWRDDLLLILALGLGVGFGLTSTLFFLASLVGNHPLQISLPAEGGLLLGLTAWLSRRRAGAPPTPRPSRRYSWLELGLATVFVQASLIALLVAFRAYSAEPYGSWDGWAIWNLHARMLFRGGSSWWTLLRQPAIAWSHLDYPLLVSASVARAWAFTGTDAPAVAALVSTCFGLATVWLLVAAAAKFCSPAVALTSGLLLLGTPFFVTFSSNEHADIPLGFFLLAAVVLVALSEQAPESRGLPALAGVVTGLAAWTKNEGLLFAVIVALAWIVLTIRRPAPRSAHGFWLGLGIALVAVIIFKVALAPPNDVASAGIVARFHQIFAWPRHRLILSSLGRDALAFGEWRTVPYVVMGLMLVARGRHRITPVEWTIAAILALTLGGYYVVYLLSPWDLAWHLNTSLVRLLLQLWPALLFSWALRVTIDVPRAPSMGRTAFATMLVMVNVALGIGSVTRMSHPLAVNELAVVHFRGETAHLVVGSGWFGREHHDRDRWIWSQGDSSLQLLVEGPQAISPRLKFKIRSLGNRTVTIAIDGREIWRQAVGTELTPQQINLPRLKTGMTTLVFRTDQPGVPESAAPDARLLTFALYNPILTVEPK